MKVERYRQNPIITPDQSKDFETKGSFNGSVQKVGSDFVMVYRGESQKLEPSIGYTRGSSPNVFEEHHQLIYPTTDWDRYGCEDPRLTYFEGEYLICYTAISSRPPKPSSIRCAVGINEDLTSSFKKYLVTPFNAKAMAIFPERINGKIVAVLSVDTDLPPSKICLATFDKIEDMWAQDSWVNWYNNLSEHIVRIDKAPGDQLEVGAVPLKTNLGWLLIFSRIENYSDRHNRIFRIDGALLDYADPKIVLSQTESPILIPQENYEKQGRIPNVVFPTGAIIEDGILNIYYGACDESICLAKIHLPELLKSLKPNNL